MFFPLSFVGVHFIHINLRGLIHVIPELALDGQTVMQGSPMTLGTDLSFFYGIGRIHANPSQTYTYNVIAGSYLSVGVVGGSVSPAVLQNLKTKLAQTKAALESGNASVVAGLSRDDVLGDMFYAVTLGYFGQYISLADVTSAPNNARHNLPMGYGTFGYEANVQNLFGIPRALTTGGVGKEEKVAASSSNRPKMDRHERPERLANMIPSTFL